MREPGDMTGSERAIHALNRLAFGPRPGDFEHVRAIGVETYIHQQLNPESIRDSRLRWSTACMIYARSI